MGFNFELSPSIDGHLVVFWRWQIQKADMWVFWRTFVSYKLWPHWKLNRARQIDISSDLWFWGHPSSCHDWRLATRPAQVAKKYLQLLCYGNKGQYKPLIAIKPWLRPWFNCKPQITKNSNFPSIVTVMGRPCAVLGIIVMEQSIIHCVFRYLWR